MQVYQTYINMMNEKIRARSMSGNPFVFNFISELTKIDEFTDNKPCVVMASPGMLQVIHFLCCSFLIQIEWFISATI